MAERFRWVLLSALSLMIFIINVDYTAVNLALIPMAAELHVDINTIQWVLSAYALAWAIVVMPAGNYADKYSKKYLCLIGLSLFLLASLLAGLAQSADLLIAARVLQGVAAAIYVPTMYALIYINFAEHERGRAIGMMSLGVGLGMAIGPFIGGVLLSAMNWRSIFFINIPLGLIALAIIYVSKKDANLTDNDSNSHEQIELKKSIIPLSLFNNLPFMGVTIGILLEQFAFSTSIVTIGLFLQKVLQLSALKSSLVYLALTSIFGVIAAAGGHWIDKIGLRIPAVLGLVLLMLGSFAFLLLSPITQLWLTCIVFAVLGIGMGLAFAALNTGVVKTVSANYIGIASRLFIMCALIGNFLGVITTTVVYQRSSLISLLHKLSDYQPLVNQLQRQQIVDYIANIGAQTHNLSALNYPLQLLIFNNTTFALNKGVSNAMLVNAIVCLLAVVVCVKLLRK